jgi:hypothetical protein
VKDTLAAINRMQAAGVISHYAIGGAVGATFYIEPAATLDVDIFVILPQVAGSSLLSLAPIYEYLTAQGGHIDGEHITIGTWPVQFLPAADGLEREALDQAVETEVEGVSTRVMTAEHLVAIALRTGRAKDYARILQFLDGEVVDVGKLELILSRHGLLSHWKRFSSKYLEK